MLTEVERRFLDAQRVARLATADAGGRPHVIPICYAADGDTGCNFYTGTGKLFAVLPYAELREQAIWL